VSGSSDGVERYCRRKQEKTMKRFAKMLSVVLVMSFGSLAFAQATQGSAPSGAKQPEVTPQQGQSAAQQQKDLAECYEIAKAETGVDLRGLGEVAPGKFDIPGMSSGAGKADASAAQAATPAKGASGTEKKAMFDKFQLANQGCMQARGYLVKKPPAPQAAQPKQ
jgi:hypothetical protein